MMTKQTFNKIGLVVSALILWPAVSLISVFGSWGSLAAVLSLVIMWYFVIQVFWYWEPEEDTVNIYGVFPHDSMLPIRIDSAKDDWESRMHEDPAIYRALLIEGGVRTELVEERLGWYAEQYGLPEFAADCKTELQTTNE